MTAADPRRDSHQLRWRSTKASMRRRDLHATFALLILAGAVSLALVWFELVVISVNAALLSVVGGGVLLLAVFSLGGPLRKRRGNKYIKPKTGLTIDAYVGLDRLEGIKHENLGSAEGATSCLKDLADIRDAQVGQIKKFTLRVVLVGIVLGCLVFISRDSGPILVVAAGELEVVPTWNTALQAAEEPETLGATLANMVLCVDSLSKARNCILLGIDSDQDLDYEKCTERFKFLAEVEWWGEEISAGAKDIANRLEGVNPVKDGIGKVQVILSGDNAEKLLKMVDVQRGELLRYLNRLFNERGLPRHVSRTGRHLIVSAIERPGSISNAEAQSLADDLSRVFRRQQSAVDFSVEGHRAKEDGGLDLSPYHRSPGDRTAKPSPVDGQSEAQDNSPERDRGDAKLGDAQTGERLRTEGDRSDGKAIPPVTGDK